MCHLWLISKAKLVRWLLPHKSQTAVSVSIMTTQKKTALFIHASAKAALDRCMWVASDNGWNIVFQEWKEKTIWELLSTLHSSTVKSAKATYPKLFVLVIRCCPYSVSSRTSSPISESSQKLQKTSMKALFTSLLMKTTKLMSVVYLKMEL